MTESAKNVKRRYMYDFGNDFSNFSFAVLSTVIEVHPNCSVLTVDPCLDGDLLMVFDDDDVNGYRFVLVSSASTKEDAMSRIERESVYEWMMDWVAKHQDEAFELIVRSGFNGLNASIDLIWATVDGDELNLSYLPNAVYFEKRGD